ncbi:DUF2569 domain-containing protein [Paenibacillus sp. JX-17]|uniref:DUF2569 domain-containing protein n=1 Tax=Paenibacillus lacisoli TaxID=3064525 RepID=A0ABT9CCL3_9BACL|nr:DUF2569 domain-containing protein [Paenibacillus sp. JX-17]MDO7907007.1 DUF2569 domain-containing protein [Paenibacillus sp. JX-17]
MKHNIDSAGGSPLSPEPKRSFRYQGLEGPSGLGGWLVLVQISLYLNTLTLLASLVSSVTMMNSDVWVKLTDDSSSFYHPLWQPFYVFVMVHAVLQLALMIWILVDLYRKKTRTRVLIITFLMLTVLWGLIDTILINQIDLGRAMDDGKSFQYLFRALLYCLVWVPYLLRSKRVRNTFVR